MIQAPGMPESPDNQAIRELRDSVKELSTTIKDEIKSQKRFTIAMAGLVIVQIVIAIGEFGTNMIPPELNLLRGAVFLLTLGAAVYAFVKFLGD